MVNTTKENKKCRIIVYEIPFLYSSWLYVVYVYLYIIHDVHLYIFSYYIRSFCLFQVQNQTLNHTLFLVCEIISIKEGWWREQRSCNMILIRRHASSSNFSYTYYFDFFSIALHYGWLLYSEKSTLREMNSLDSMVLGNIGHPLISRKCV